MRGTAIERFMNFALPEPNSGCWIWMGTIKENGYGVFFPTREKIWYAHRYSFVVHKGQIPDGLVINHICGIRFCVNPDHLEAITHIDNITRGMLTSKIHNKSKTHCPRGHEYTPENTLVYRGGRYCRKCKNLHIRNYEKWRNTSVAQNRPTAHDRELAHIFYNMKPGSYRVIVEDTKNTLAYFSKAKLKVEGSITIKLTDKEIHILPEQ